MLHSHRLDSIKVVGSIVKNRLLYPTAFKKEARRCLIGGLNPNPGVFPPKYCFFPTTRLLYREGIKGLVKVNDEVKKFASGNWGEWNAGEIIFGKLLRDGIKLPLSYFLAMSSYCILSGEDLSLILAYPLPTVVMTVLGVVSASYTSAYESESTLYGIYAHNRWISWKHGKSPDAGFGGGEGGAMAVGAKVGQWRWGRRWRVVDGGIDSRGQTKDVRGTPQTRKALEILGIGTSPLSEITEASLKGAYWRKAKNLYLGRGVPDKTIQDLQSAYKTIKAAIG